MCIKHLLKLLMNLKFSAESWSHANGVKVSFCNFKLSVEALFERVIVGFCMLPIGNFLNRLCKMTP